MLPKTSRLVADQDFSRVYKRGRRISGHNLQFFFLRTDLSQSRFGFVISKKSVPKSTGRNRIKRVLRDCVSKQATKLKIGYDVIIQGQAGSRTADAAVLREELAQLLQRAKLLR